MRELSSRYRTAHSQSGQPFLRSPLDAKAYAAYRLPATFGAIEAVFREVHKRRPDFRPRTVLDVGGGPGTAVWAASEVWPELEHIVSLERDREMMALGEKLAGYASSHAVRHQVWRQVDISVPWESDRVDIVVAAYVMGELPASTRADWMRRLWHSTSDICVVIEPGTPPGFALVKQAGEQPASAGAHVLAPFPVEWQCLEQERDWCHFCERVPRSRLLRAAKTAKLSYEDEKYSYVAASRIPGLPLAARVIRHPQTRSGHVRLTLCTSAGVKNIVISKSDRQAYRRARDLRWGSAIEPEEATIYGL